MSDEVDKSLTFVEIRKAQGLTQKDLATAIGVTEDTVANWERGRSVPRLTIPQMKELCRVLKISSIDQLPDDFSNTSSMTQVSSKGG